MTSLTLEEAVPLGYALLSHVAAEAGIRTLAIKGPVLTEQGLRAPRTSVDVDLLVEPAGYRALAARFEAIGWLLSDDVTSPQLMAPHSTTYRHPSWPCEVDLHHYYPGFLADPAEVFEVLWARRTSVRLAGRDVAASDRVGNAAVSALHFLRVQTNDAWTTQLADLVHRVQTTWTDDELADLAQVAADTGATEPLGPVLDALGVPRVAPTRELVVPVADWRLWTHAETRVSLRWIVGMRRLPWWRRPTYVWRAVWPPADDETSRRHRRDRLRRGLSAVPTALRELRAHERSRPD